MVRVGTLGLIIAIMAGCASAPPIYSAAVRGDLNAAEGGETALVFAKANGLREVVALLRKHGAK